ncbi:MAG: NAD(P)H-hydrate dehydratase [Deltaproteobacteria bacterium]|nr:NAD(P)H-hydrate dehydratase [Deltaproteobacteria bacterium]
MKVSSVEQMQAMDRQAAEKLGISEEVLMENAGAASCQVLSREFGVAGRRYVIFCGIGNNGGDGLVVARHILSGGGTPRVLLVGDPGRFRGAAKTNLEIIGRLPIEVKRVKEIETVRSSVIHSDGIIDALFGTGLDRAVSGIYGQVIDLINMSGKPVLSLDIPSGVSGETGEVMGTAVRADHTVTYGLPKIGNMLYPGHGLCGKLHLSRISFPPALCDDEAIKVEINGFIALPLRERTLHKGSAGDVLFIAGAAGYYGAPYFSAMSFLKAGGGYARLGAPWSMTPFLATRGSEIVFVPQAETTEGSLSLKNKDALLELAGRADMVVMGPGLSLAAETQELIRELVAAIEKPLLIDGDGITALAAHKEIIRNRPAPTVLTPHPGEMSRLTGKPIAEIEKKRIPILQETAADLRALIVLKGAHSLIGMPERRVFINLSGNPGMATAGSGDVLTGTIAAMSGLGLPLEEAVRKGVFIHGLSGDLAAADKGEDGITAQDILNYLPYAMRQDREGLDEILAERYEGPAIV